MNAKRFFAVMAAAWLGGAAFAQTDLQPVAIVRLTKPDPITVKQVKAEAEKMARTTLLQSLRRQPTAAEVSSAVRSLSASDKRQLLDLMINEKLVLQAAERDKIAVAESEVNSQIDQYRNQLAQSMERKPTDAEFAQAIKNETGLDLPAFRDTLKKQIIMQKYLLSKKRSEIEGIKPPTEEEVVNAYTLSKADFTRPETVRFSMIEVPFGSDKAKAKELADKLAKDIGGNPSRFDEAVVKGQTPNAGYRAGDGGYLPRNLQAQQAAGKLFIDTAFRLKQGEVSPMLEAARSFQMIKITETYGMKNLELDDIAQLGSKITVRQYISGVLFQQKQQEVLAKAQEDLVKELRKGSPFQIMEANLNW